MVCLLASDGERFVVERDVADCSVLLNNLLEDLGESEEPIPLVNVSSAVLQKVLEHCEHHKEDVLLVGDAARRKKDNSEWDQNFIAVDQEMLFEIILAANYLDIKSLLDLGCRTVAGMIAGKTTEEIRSLFGIVNDFSAEEEVQVKRENQWAETQ